MEKVKLIVLEGHTLGCIHPEQPSMAGVLFASPLRGAYSLQHGPVPVTGRQWRLASEADFADFNVSFKGFEDAEKYEYSLPDSPANNKNR